MVCIDDPSTPPDVAHFLGAPIHILIQMLWHFTSNLRTANMLINVQGKSESNLIAFLCTFYANVIARYFT